MTLMNNRKFTNKFKRSWRLELDDEIVSAGTKKVENKVEERRLLKRRIRLIKC